MLDSCCGPGSSHVLAVGPIPEPPPVCDSIEGNELDVRTALKHPTDHGKVTARRPQTGPRRHVSVPAVQKQQRRGSGFRSDRLRSLIEAVGKSAEALDDSFRRRAGPFKPSSHGPSVNIQERRGVSLRQSG